MDRTFVYLLSILVFVLLCHMSQGMFTYSKSLWNTNNGNVLPPECFSWEVPDEKLTFNELWPFIYMMCDICT